MRKLMNRQWQSTTAVGIALVMAMALGAMPTMAQKSIEQYKGNAIVQTGGRASMVEINIYRWSSDDERNEILDAIKEATENKKLTRHVAQTLRGQKKTGYAFLAGQQGYPLRYSREFKTEEGRQIILATDRPVSFGEVYQHSKLGDFDVTVILLDLDDSGSGNGIISVGTEVLWNDKTGKLEVTNTTSQPVKVGDVRMVK
ncbi:MAG: hypothetical protein EP299_10645 [Acidobacteria bacterium]|nr:MAG: hypothetical protein EP299_10645 [Acidobacteriota bacterium]